MSELLHNLLVANALVFWLVITTEIGLLIYWVENRSPNWAAFSIVCLLGVLNWAGYPVWSTIVTHPDTILYAVAGYLGIGTIWAVIRWYFYVKNEREKYDEFKKNWLKSQYLEPNAILEGETLKGFLRALDNEVCYHDLDIHPQVGKNKESIQIWIIHWPWSFCWTLIDDPIRKTVKAIYNGISNRLQAVSDKIWSGTPELKDRK